MSVQTVKFNHEYHKLKKKSFTTIRGKSWFTRMKVGDEVAVTTPSQTFLARVTKLERETVSDMTLEFLKADAEYPGFIIRSVQDFIDLLNSFRGPMWVQVTLESQLTIVSLERI